MFIMTGFKESTAEVRIFDTSDETNEIVSVYTVAEAIRARKMKVYGIGRLEGNTASMPPDAISYEVLGIYISVLTARKTLARYYIDKGMPQDRAFAMAGLSTQQN